MPRILFSLLIFLMEMGLFPISHHMLSMDSPRMDKMTWSQQSDVEHGNMGENFTGSCCDGLAPFSTGCFFLVPQFTWIDLFGGSEHIINSNSIVQAIYIETLTPPPKA